MKRKNVFQKMSLVAGASCLAMLVFACPATSLSAQAAEAGITLDADEQVSPCSDDIQYRYKIENGKVYKRLYNYSNGDWIGDWIYVCDYAG